MSDENGHQNGQVRVKFGPGDTQDMPVEWAQNIIMELARPWLTSGKGQFGKLLAEAGRKAQ